MYAGYGAGAYPTVANGELYVLGNSPGSLPYALKQSDGNERWPARSLHSGDNSTPTLDGSTVYVSLAGPQTHDFDRATGTERWQQRLLHRRRRVHDDALRRPVYAQDGLIHRASDGLVVGSHWQQGVPSWSGDQGVAYSYNALRGFGPGSTRRAGRSGSTSTHRWRHR